MTCYSLMILAYEDNQIWEINFVLKILSLKIWGSWFKNYEVSSKKKTVINLWSKKKNVVNFAKIYKWNSQSNLSVY